MKIIATLIDNKKIDITNVEIKTVNLFKCLIKTVEFITTISKEANNAANEYI